MKLSNTKAIITGGSRGMGKEIAEHFITEGSDVVICSRNSYNLHNVFKEFHKKFKKQNTVISAIQCDVSIKEEVDIFINKSFEEMENINTLVLNAGVYGPMGPTESVSLDDWIDAINVNLYGVLLPCRALIPHLKQQKYGKIIILSGGGATNPLPNISAYAASKAAVIRLMETLAEELKPWNIDVNAIAPGPLATDMVDEVLKAGPDKVGKEFYEKNVKWKTTGATPLRLGAQLAVYLASKESDGITGKLISAQWDNWREMHTHLEELKNSDIYCLRRITPKDRDKTWI